MPKTIAYLVNKEVLWDRPDFQKKKKGQVAMASGFEGDGKEGPHC